MMQKRCAILPALTMRCSRASGGMALFLLLATLLMAASAPHAASSATAKRSAPAITAENSSLPVLEHETAARGQSLQRVPVLCPNRYADRLFCMERLAAQGRNWP